MEVGFVMFVRKFTVSTSIDEKKTELNSVFQSDPSEKMKTVNSVFQ